MARAEDERTPSESSKQQVQPAPDVTSSEEDESGSESESDSVHSPMNSGESVPAVEPIVSKPMENPPEAVTKPSSEPTAPYSPEEEESSIKVKRTAPQVKTPEPKKAKKKGGDTEDGSDRAKKTIGDDQKRQLFQRVWSEEDEVVILKAIKWAEPFPPSVDTEGKVNRLLELTEEERSFKPLEVGAISKDFEVPPSTEMSTVSKSTAAFSLKDLQDFVGQSQTGQQPMVLKKEMEAPSVGASLKKRKSGPKEEC